LATTFPTSVLSDRHQTRSGERFYCFLIATEHPKDNIKSSSTIYTPILRVQGTGTRANRPQSKAEARFYFDDDNNQSSYLTALTLKKSINAASSAAPCSGERNHSARIAVSCEFSLDKEENDVRIALSFE